MMLNCLYKTGVYRLIFTHLRYFFIGLINLISGNVSIDYIYSRFRIVVKEKIEHYDFITLDIQTIMEDVDNLQTRLIAHVHKLDMNEENKNKLLEFLNNWSNLFLKIELIKLKTGLITEKEFIGNISAQLVHRCRELEAMLIEGETDEETERLVKMLQFSYLLGEFSKRFNSLQEMRDMLIDIVSICDNLVGIVEEENLRKEHVCYT